MSQHPLIHRWFAVPALTVCVALVACGKTGDGSDAAGSDSAPTSSLPSAAADNAPATGADRAPAPNTDTEPAEPIEIRNSTPEEAIDTWLAGVRAGQLDVALAVLDPASPGAATLGGVRDGIDRAKSDPTGASMLSTVRGLWADEIAALTYDMIAIDADSATFRFSSPTKPEPWEVTVIRTPDGWRIQPPDTGMPQG